MKNFNKCDPPSENQLCSLLVVFREIPFLKIETRPQLNGTTISRQTNRWTGRPFTVLGAADFNG